jgi:hypothetical protein
MTTEKRKFFSVLSVKDSNEKSEEALLPIIKSLLGKGLGSPFLRIMFFHCLFHMSTIFPTTRSVSEVESEGKNLLWQFPVQKEKKKCSISGYTTRLIIIPYILGLGAKTEEKIF